MAFDSRVRLLIPFYNAFYRLPYTILTLPTENEISRVCHRFSSPPSLFRGFKGGIHKGSSAGKRLEVNASDNSKGRQAARSPALPPRLKTVFTSSPSVNVDP